MNVSMRSPGGSFLRESCFYAVCNVCYRGARCVSVARRVGCSSFSCERVFCDRVLRKELRWVPSCNGASMVFITRRRVAFKSDAVVRGTVGFLLQVISPRVCGMFSNYFPSVSREKTLLSCCTTRSMAKGVTERSRKYVYFNFRRRREFSCISLNTCGLDSLSSLVTFRVEGELVSCQRVMYLMRCFPPSLTNMMCAVVWHCVPAAVVHGLWCRHCD